MNKVKLLILIFFVAGSAAAQNLNQYQYVRVPEKFEFLSDENQYQLNALTAFLFEKYGFNTLYEEDIPEGISPCQILNANIENKSNLFRTRVQLNLENCTDEVVFTSKVGKSRKKDYKKSYHDAVRDAFKSVKKLKYGYSATENVDNPLQEKRGVDPDKNISVVSKTSSVKGITGEEKTENSEKYYVNGNQRYNMEKTPSGFVISRAGAAEKTATLLKSAGGENYIYTSDNIKGNAFFDASGTLVVEYVATNTGQLVSLEYRLED